MEMILLVWCEISWQQIKSIITNRHRLTSFRSSRWWYDLSYAKEAISKNDIISMIWGVIQQIEHIIANRHRLTTCRAADDDMIWVIQWAMNRNDVVR